MVPVRLSIRKRLRQETETWIERGRGGGACGSYLERIPKHSWMFGMIPDSVNQMLAGMQALLMYMYIVWCTSFKCYTQKPCPYFVISCFTRFSKECRLDNDEQVTCTNCPEGYEGRRCDRCAPGYQGNPMSPGDRCRRGNYGERISSLALI